MRTLLLGALALFTIACAGPQAAAPDTEATSTVAEPAPTATEPTSTVTLMSEVDWQPLNPARGDASPKAATLWGDRSGAGGPTGFLVKFVDGFESPPHIHNVTYRGVVIHGLIHNDDPDADEMWMPTGSYWTQPKGDAHITSAKGSNNVAFIEINEGPYLVHPVDDAFASGETPINVDASKVAWVDASGAQTAFLWGDPKNEQSSGILVKLPAGSSATMRGHGAWFHAVVIQGKPAHHATQGAKGTMMEPGSVVSSEGGSAQVSCGGGEACVLYVRTAGDFEVVSTQPN